MGRWVVVVGGCVGLAGARPRCQQLVLVGDHCQLPPTVGSDLARGEGLDVALFSGLVRAGVPTCLLGTQYRMHPAIAAFPSACFYGGRIDDGVAAAHRPPVPGFPWPRPDFPVCFLPVADHAREQGDGTSHSSPAEGEAVAAVLRGVLGAGLAPADVGVVTPYAAQVAVQRGGGVARIEGESGGGGGGGGAVV